MILTELHVGAVEGGTPQSLGSDALAAASAAAALAAASHAAARKAMPAPQRKLSKPNPDDFFKDAVLPSHIVENTELWDLSEVLGLTENLVFVGIKPSALETVLKSTPVIEIKGIRGI